MTTLEERWKKIIRGEGGFVGQAVRGPLWLLSLPYRWIVRFRNRAYERHWLRARRPKGPVIISVGNLVIGGTGKTPLVHLLARELQPSAKLAVLSRGYRAQAEKSRKPIGFGDNLGAVPDASVCGDEIHLLAQRVPQALFFVGKNRRQAAHMASAAGAQILLLDDGLQHRRLARDLDIVMIDGQDPLGNGHLFPRGTLRDRPEELRRAHLLVFNHIRNKAHFQEIRELLAPFSQAPAIGVAPKVTEVRDLGGKRLSSFQGTKVGIFCGIAQPKRFHDTVKGLGADIVDTLYSPDHRLPGAESLEAFAKRCKARGATWLLCTEKDRAKIGKPPRLALPIAYASIALDIVEGASTWKQFIEDVRSRVR